MPNSPRKAFNVAELSSLFKKPENITEKITELKITPPVSQKVTATEEVNEGIEALDISSSVWRKTQNSGFFPEDQRSDKRRRFENETPPKGFGFG